MEERIERILKSATTIPVLDEPKPGILKCVTFHLFGISGGLFGGGKAAEEYGSCQVDIWYQKKTHEVKEEIKKIRETIKGQSSFSYPEMSYIYDQGNKIHHTYFTFELLKESEE